MERKRNFIKNIILSALLCLLCLFVSAACSYDQVEEIAVSGKSEILAGSFDYEDYTVEIRYESGKSETVPLDKSMLSVEDNLKVFFAGEQTLTVNYMGKTCEFGLTVCLCEFTDLRFDGAVADDSGESVITARYSGESVTAEVFKNYPEGTEIYYPNGNSFVNAGTYSVTAIVSRRNYVTATLTAKVEIEKSTYDMSGVTLEDCDFDYDGKPHTVEISGKLPDGVSVTYPDNNNKQVDAGTYKVTAKFVSSNGNYQPIEDKTATMVINKKKYDAKDLVFEDSAVTYDGKGHSIKAENVPSGVSVEYSVEKESLSGKTPVDGVEATDAGTYIYTAEFHSLNSNYEDLPSAEAKLTITPAKYDTSDIILESAEIVYDGKPHSLSYRLAEGLTKLPESFDSYGWYEKNGKILYENDDENGEYVSEVSESGTYAYTLIFIDENGNYEIPELTACLVIDKIDYDVSRVAVEDYAYTGNLIGVQVNGVPEGLGVELYYFRSDDIPACDENGNYTNCIKDDVTGKSGVTDAGEYRVLVKFTGQDNVNYNYLQPKMLTFCVYEVTEAD